jgi:phage-related baseplate assembly protein
MADKVQFINTDAEATLADFVADYEQLSGKVLQPAQAEQLLIQAAVNRITLLKIGVNEAANQNLVAFATGAALEYLGQLVGVTRLTAAPAQCIIRFNLVTGHGPLVIPAGLRVQSIDGQLIFITTESNSVIEDDTYADIPATCSTLGTSGNEYAPGAISVILDPQAYIATAGNTDTTNGGSDAETDDEMRERIQLAPAQFSVAGPTDAYKFFAKSAHPLIIDVAVTSPDPGDVYIYPFLLDGEAPGEEIIDAVNAACNSEKVRPLTDTVYVEAPTEIEYEIEIELVLLTTAVESVVLDAVTANVEAFKTYRKTKLGIDAIRNQLMKCAMVEGVYDATVVSPVSDIVVEPSEFTTATATTITVTGTHDE